MVTLIVRSTVTPLNPLIRMEGLDPDYAIELVGEWLHSGALGGMAVELVREVPRLELVGAR